MQTCPKCGKPIATCACARRALLRTKLLWLLAQAADDSRDDEEKDTFDPGENVHKPGPE